MKFPQIFDVSKPLSLQRGVPENLFESPTFDLQKYVRKVTHEKGKTVKRLSEKYQIKLLENTIEHPVWGNYVYCISSDFNPQKAQLVAFTLFCAAMQHYNPQNDPDSRLPYWHKVIGGFNDRLRDDSDFARRIGTPSLIVLDHLAVNSTASKIEKVHDLLETYSSVPRVVIVTGTCPVQFMHQHLYSAVNRVLHIGASNLREL